MSRSNEFAISGIFPKHSSVVNRGKGKNINQGLSKHSEVGSTPLTKFTKIITVFWDLLGAIKRLVLKDRFHLVHNNLSVSNE